MSSRAGGPGALRGETPSILSPFASTWASKPAEPGADAEGAHTGRAQGRHGQRRTGLAPGLRPLALTILGLALKF